MDRLIPDVAKSLGWAHKHIAEYSGDQHRSEGNSTHRDVCDAAPARTPAKARTQEELTELVKKLIRQIPEQKVAFKQLIEMRIREMTAGTRSDAAILFGNDCELLTTNGAEVATVLNTFAGDADVRFEQLISQPVLQIKFVRTRSHVMASQRRRCSMRSHPWVA